MKRFIFSSALVLIAGALMGLVTTAYAADPCQCPHICNTYTLDGGNSFTLSDNGCVLIGDATVGLNSVGTLTVDNGSITVSSQLIVGNSQGSVGQVWINGGALVMTNANHNVIGNSGFGQLTLSNGNVLASEVQLGGQNVCSPTNICDISDEGSLIVAGGMFALNAGLDVGDLLGSDGTALVTGGQLLVTNGTITVGHPLSLTSPPSFGQGAFIIAGGLVQANSLVLTAGGFSGFTFSGGTLSIGGAMVSNGQTFVVGNGTNAATFNLLGGSYSLANNLEISSNATLSGCGVIAGNIQVDAGGTVLVNCDVLDVVGTLTNNGTIRITSPGELSTFFFGFPPRSSGTLVNNGVIDLINGGSLDFGSSFINHGIVLDASSVRISKVAISGQSVIVQIPSVTGHAYQLQAVKSFTAGTWTDVGAPQNGANNVLLTFTDPGGATNRPALYYRVKVTAPLAADDASDPAYSSGWTNGSNGGMGFSPWTLTATGVIGSTSNGFFIGSSTNNAGGSTPGIDVTGKSWGIYANSGNLTAAYRTVADGPLLVGQSLLISMDNGFINSGSSVGFVLRNGNSSGSANAYTNGARLVFEYVGYSPSNSYQVVDAGGARYIGVAFTGTGLHLVVTLNTADTYTLLVIDNASGNTNATVSGTLAGTSGSSIDSIALFNNDAGSGPDYDLFFNSLQITGL